MDPVEHPIKTAPSKCYSLMCLKISSLHLMQLLHPHSKQRKMLFVTFGQILHLPMYRCNCFSVSGILVINTSGLIYFI